jgi:ABC-2 type transport system ATP-binding protein
MALAIETTGLARRFGAVRAVDGIDLHVPDGSVFGFLGPNGSGKTTTIRMLVGLVRPTAGSARLLGEPVGPRAPVVRRVGVLVERPAFYPFLSPVENLVLFGVTAGLEEGPLRARSERLVERVGLGDARRRRVGEFSTGMRQRLAIALAVLGDPPLLILDEPTNGLDPAGVAEVRSLIGQLATDGITVFLSTHVLTEVEQVCDRVAILDHGRIVTQTATAELLRGDGTVRLRFDSPAEVALAAEALERAGRAVTSGDPPGAGLEVAGAAADSSGLVRLLASVGVFPAEVRVDRTSLESVFLQLTREGGPGGSDATAEAPEPLRGAPEALTEASAAPAADDPPTDGAA